MAIAKGPGCIVKGWDLLTAGCGVHKKEQDGFKGPGLQRNSKSSVETG
jgi:hypothetical protein